MITSKQITKKLNDYLHESLKITSEVAKSVGDSIGIDWDKTDFNQFHQGINIELEHGDANTQTDLIPGPDSTDTSLKIIGKIALAHLDEIPDYYTRLKDMEAGAES